MFQEMQFKTPPSFAISLLNTGIILTPSKCDSNNLITSLSSGKSNTAKNITPSNCK